MELRIIEADETHSHVALKGKLDIQGTAAIELRFSTATAARGKPTLVDLSEVDFIASLGMGMLISCARTLSRKGVRMVLVDPQLLVEKTLKAAGIQQIVPIAHGLEQARAKLQPESA
jgi:anti-anti-sigma factor